MDWRKLNRSEGYPIRGRGVVGLLCELHFVWANIFVNILYLRMVGFGGIALLRHII